jgi:DUF1365 family protein
MYVVELNEYKNGLTGEASYVALILTPTEIKFVPIGDAKKIEAAISDFREKTIAVFLNYYDSTKVSNKTLALKTTVSGKKIALTRKNLVSLFFSYPFQTIKVITLIHYHALCLFIKKIKYNKKPLKPKNNLS